MTRIRPAGWLALAGVLFLVAVAGYGWLISAFPHYWLQTDLTVFRDGGLAVRSDPAQLYSLWLGVAHQPFIYAPFAALLFAVASPLSFTVWQVALTAATIALLPVVAYLCLGLAGRPAGVPRLAGALAIGAAGLWLEPVVMTLSFGQVNVLIMALVVADLALPDRFVGKGIGIGLAAAIKLIPLIFIPYLLLTRRVRAAVVSLLTFGATIALGFALLPAASAAFWRGQFKATGHFRLLNQSLYGTVLRLTHNGPQAHAIWLTAAIVVGVLGLGTAAVARRRGHELLGFVVCAATSLLISPVSWSHHYVYVVPALALAACGPRRRSRRIAAAATVIALFACWPMPIGGDGGFHLSSGWLPRGLLRLVPHYGTSGTGNPELHWNALEAIAGNYYVIAALAFIVAVAFVLAVKRRSVRVASETARRPGPERQLSGPARQPAAGRAPRSDP